MYIINDNFPCRINSNCWLVLLPIMALNYTIHMLPMQDRFLRILQNKKFYVLEHITFWEMKVAKDLIHVTNTNTKNISGFFLTSL